jgi:uncharacterized protein DUF4340
MRRTIPILAAVLALQLLLAGLLGVRSDPLRGSAPDLPLLSGAVTAADHVVLESASAPGEPPENTRIEFSRHGKGWTMDSYFGAPAVASRVDAMLGRLAGLKRGLPIATSAAALQRFRVADQDYARRITLGQAGKTLGSVYLGNSAGVRSVDARSGADRVVYAVDYATYEIPIQPNEWFDGDLLQRRAEDLQAIDIDNGEHHPLRLERHAAQAGKAAGWSASPARPGPALLEAQADALAHSLAGLHVDEVLGVDPKPEWQQTHPLMEWKLTAADQSSETWTLSKPDGTDQYRVLKSSKHPWYFAISTTAATPLLTASGRDTLFGSAKPSH